MCGGDPSTTNDEQTRQAREDLDRVNNLDPVRKVKIVPEYTLAKLINNEMGVAVEQRILRLFIKAHWSKIAKLAHEIHED